MTGNRISATGDTASDDSRSQARADGASQLKRDALIDCGWGRLVFAQTFDSPARIAKVMENEAPDQRDVAFYVSEPHVVLAAAPQSLFLDPSHSFRLDLTAPRDDVCWETPDFTIRPAEAKDERAVNRLYTSRGMVPVAKGFCASWSDNPALTVLVAEDGEPDSEPIGVVMGVDHRSAFGDPEAGSSLWALSVDPQALRPGVGVALVAALADRLAEAGCRYMDLSVMHDNREAIALYDKLGFERIPVYCVKRKNPINEKLFLGPQPEADLNIYAQIIVDEARRRGIAVDVEDGEAGLFRLALGGRAISCRESLSDMTSAVALSRCDDKRLTRRLLQKAKLNVPDQIPGDDAGRIREFLDTHGSVVVKPARGEMGRGVAVDLTEIDDVMAAVARAGELCDDVIVEQCVEGMDLRIIVIDGEVVAAAVRRPPRVRGDGVHTVIELIAKQSRRREAATGGESTIPLDEDTERCVESHDYQMLDVPDYGETLTVRKAANLHAGGTIHDVTPRLHPDLARAAIRGAEVLDIPVVGFDFIVPDPARPDYVIIEANERPGLANHEPQPTAERFIDFLFPQTRADIKSSEAQA
ncbi:MAG: N-acetylglutaminylglutamine synthetase [Alphaproteobacteria bacterium]|nr:N-acetylglutaminylglutamine synthetase [Alphaproteobacteria bacterium]